MKSDDVRRFGVVGAGQMGRGIAQVAAQSGFDVKLSDASQELADKGKQTISKQLDRLVSKERLSAEERDAVLGRISPVASPAAFDDVDVAIEAATENIDLKLTIFKSIDEALPSGAILASNTSSISITKLAAATSRPSLVAGMHFMNPVPLMKLCEVVRGVQTSDETYDTVKTLAQKMGKTVITSNDHPGFLVNRMLIPFLNEACFALQEGVGSAEDIDAGAKLGLNHPMGPLELSDLIGLDTVLFIADVLYRDIGDPKYRAAVVLRNLVAAGSRQEGRRRSRSMSELCLVEQSGHVATLTINRPDKLNALNAGVIDALGGALAELLGRTGEQAVRCAVLTGAGKAFVAGADIAAMADMTVEQARRFSEKGLAIGHAMENAPFPIIAAVNGFALGGGLELAMACDFLYASEKAKLGQPEVSLGVTPGFGGTQRLARRVGVGQARELLYTGAMIRADEALRIGLVNRVLAPEQLLNAARETADAIAKQGPLAVAACKRVVLRGVAADQDAGLSFEAEAFAALFASADQKSGMKAFLAKEKASFSGS
jgi:3-hydroxybutyryl-CoA dehydrogenase